MQLKSLGVPNRIFGTDLMEAKRWLVGVRLADCIAKRFGKVKRVSMKSGWPQEIHPRLFILEVFSLLREKHYDNHIKELGKDTARFKEIIDGLGSSRRFQTTFKLSTGMEWQDTTEFKEYIFSTYYR